MRVTRLHNRNDDARCKGNMVILTLKEAAKRFSETGDFSLSEHEGVSQYDGDDPSLIDVSKVTTSYDKISTALKGLDILNSPTADPGDPGPSIEDVPDDPKVE